MTFAWSGGSHWAALSQTGRQRTKPGAVTVLLGLTGVSQPFSTRPLPRWREWSLFTEKVGVSWFNFLVLWQNVWFKRCFEDTDSSKTHRFEGWRGNTKELQQLAWRKYQLPPKMAHCFFLLVSPTVTGSSTSPFKCWNQSRVLAQQ